MYGVTNLDEEIYFHGGGPSVVGDPSSGEVGPDSVMWLCSQTKLITSVSLSLSLSQNWFIWSCQLAALILVEQGKITFDTPVADYFPEFRNPIIVDRTDTQKASFKPAETTVTLKHLLTFTGGLFYPDTATMKEDTSANEVHLSKDPTSDFFRNIIVRFYSFGR